MGSFVTTPQLIDGIDSFYEYIKSRVQDVNSSRVFGGVVQARDWPMKEATLEAPYLLMQKSTPVPYAKSVSQSQPNILHRLSWVWMIQGDNIAANAQTSNRGNKYRINLQMIQEMYTGHYPGFCEKYQYSVTDNGSGQPLQVSTAYNPALYIRWTQPGFQDKIDNTSGILYCSGNVALSDFAPAISQ